MIRSNIIHSPILTLGAGLIAIYLLLGSSVTAEQLQTNFTVGTPVFVVNTNVGSTTMGIPRWKGFMMPGDTNRFWVTMADWGSTPNHLAYSTDAGLSWVAAGITLPDDQSLDQHVSLAGDEAGNIYTVFPYSQDIQLRKVNFPAQSQTDKDPVRLVSAGAGSAAGPRANVMIQPSNQRLWVFTRESYIPSQNVRYHYSDNDGVSWTRGVADPTFADQVRIGSMPYVNGQPALVVLYLGSSLGFKYYMWNGTAFEARPDAQIFAGNVGFDRAFTHNVVAGDVFHLIFENGDNLHHCWKSYNGGTGAWNQAIIDTTPYETGTTGWEVASVARGNELVLFYRKLTSADTSSGEIYCRVWSQDQQAWSGSQLVSAGIGGSNHWPNTAMSVPQNCSTIPVVWSSVDATEDGNIWSNRITLPPPGPCCVGLRGNVNAVGITDLSDLSALVSFLTGATTYIGCPEGANVNAQGIIDLSDLSMLIAYLTGAGTTLPQCP